MTFFFRLAASPGIESVLASLPNWSTADSFIAALPTWASVLSTTPAVLAFIGVLMLMVLVHEFGHWVPARKFGIDVPVFSIGFFSKPRISFMAWGTRFQITPWLIGGYVKLDPSADDFMARPAWKRSVILLGGVFMNMVMAFTVMFTLYLTVGQPISKVLTITQVGDQTTPAGQAGFQPGDVLISVNGIKPANGSDIGAIMRRQFGSAAVLVQVKRNDTAVTLGVHPGTAGIIGVSLQESGTSSQRLGVADAAVQGAYDLFDMSDRIAGGLGMLVKLLPPPPGLPAHATDIHGMWAIGQIVVVAYSQGAFTFWSLVALLSVNLAFMNILPIPGLDGGHLMSIAAEKIMGKPLSKEMLGRLALIGFMLLMMLMAYGLMNDFIHPIISK